MKTGPCAGLALMAGALLLPACTPAPESASPPPPGATAPVAPAEHLAFEPGATALLIAGTLGGGQSARYVVAGHEGDLLMAHAVSPGEDVGLSVHRLDQDARLQGAGGGPSYFVGRLPVTGGYLLEIEGAGDPGPFELEVEIPRHLPLTWSVSRVELSGMMHAHAPLAFVATVEEGRTLRARAASPGDAVRLVVHGAEDGQALAGWESPTTAFTGRAPRSQDYVLRLDPGEEATEFQLSVEVE